jgi:hypothetical protein
MVTIVGDDDRRTDLGRVFLHLCDPRRNDPFISAIGKREGRGLASRTGRHSAAGR